MSEIFIKTEKGYNHQRLSWESTAEEADQNREVWNFDRENNPHYIRNYDKINENYDNIPITTLDIPVSLKITDVNLKKVKNVKHKNHKKINKNLKTGIFKNYNNRIYF